MATWSTFLTLKQLIWHYFWQPVFLILISFLANEMSLFSRMRCITCVHAQCLPCSCPAFWLFGSILPFDAALYLNSCWFFPPGICICTGDMKDLLHAHRYPINFPHKLWCVSFLLAVALLISLGYCCEPYSLGLDNMIVTTAVPAWLCCPAVLLLPSFIPSSKGHFALVYDCLYLSHFPLQMPASL